MSGILDLLNSDLGKTIVNGVSQTSGQPQDKTSKLLTMAMPVLMEAMKRNASTPEGAKGLMNALNNKHDGSILDNLGGLFEGGVTNDVVDDGGRILEHVLGNKKQTVETVLSQKSGIDSGTVSQILKVAAPILMGVLGKQKKEKQIADPNSLVDLVGGLLKGNSPQQEQSFLESILDADGDGSIIDDVAGMVLGGNGSKKKGGLGGLLGGLFGKR
jgi:hypothetical protein